MPYRGTGPAIADLVGGQVPIGIVGVTGQVLEFHRTGKMRVLAVTSPSVSPLRLSFRRRPSWASPA